MADDDDGRDFDTDMGGSGGSQDGDRGNRDARDEVDDELEDLSREELYDRLKDANNTAKKYRLRLKRARSGAGSRRDSGHIRGEEDDDRDDDSRDGDRRGSGRDNRRGDRDRDDSRRSSGSRRDREDDREVVLEERAIRAEAKTYLAEAGIPANRLARAVRLIDLQALELDGEDLLGIDEEIEDLKEEWPELFRRSRSSRDDEDDDRGRDSRRDSGTRRRVSRADTRAGGGTGGRDRGNKQKTSTEIAVEQLLGLRDR